MIMVRPFELTLIVKVPERIDGNVATALRGVAATQVQAAAATLTLDEALHGTLIDQAVRPVIETITHRWGVTCSYVEVRRLAALDSVPAY